MSAINAMFPTNFDGSLNYDYGIKNEGIDKERVEDKKGLKKEVRCKYGFIKPCETCKHYIADKMVCEFEEGVK